MSPATWTVHLSSSGSAPVNPAECERVEFEARPDFASGPRTARAVLSLLMRPELEAALGPCPYVVDLYRNRATGLLFVRASTGLGLFSVGERPAAFFEVGRDALAEMFDALDIDADSRRRWTEPAAPLPYEAPPVVEIKSHEGEETDYEALADRLLRDRHAKPAALVRFMATRRTASYEDIGDELYGDGGPPNETTIRTLVCRTNNRLQELRSTLKFRTTGRYVVGTVGPD